MYDLMNGRDIYYIYLYILRYVLKIKYILLSFEKESDDAD